LSKPEPMVQAQKNDVIQDDYSDDMNMNVTTNKLLD
jgi:hypothetical protein